MKEFAIVEDGTRDIKNVIDMFDSYGYEYYHIICGHKENFTKLVKCENYNVWQTSAVDIFEKSRDDKWIYIGNEHNFWTVLENGIRFQLNIVEKYEEILPLPNIFEIEKKLHDIRNKIGEKEGFT